MQKRCDDRGATSVEYALYVALVAGAILGGVVFLTGALGVAFASVAADPMIVGGTSTIAAAPSTPAPSTPAPSTPAPSTPAPSTPAATTPGAARALAASSPAKGTLKVSWDAPATDGGSDVLGYDVEIDDISSGSTCAAPFSSSATQKVLSTTTSFTSVPGTKYCLRVRVINAEGTSDWVQKGPVSVTPMTEPGAPRTVAATSPSRGTLTVTWAAPEDNGGSDVTSYTVEIDKRSGESSCARSFDDSEDPMTVTGTSATFTDLDGSAYCVRVQATNREGGSDWAQAGVFAMSASAPSAPRDLQEDGESEDSIDLAWDSPSNDGGSDVTDYVVEYSKKGAGAWTVVSDGISDKTETTVKGLAENTTYEFRVAAVNAAGPGDYSEILSHSTDKKAKKG